MSVLIDKSTKILIQGFTGKMGSFHAEEMIKYGSNVVGGVTPGKGGSKHLNLPVFNTVKEAVETTGASASILFVPPAFAADSAMEAADSGVKTCVAIVDGIPSHDMIRIKRYMRRYSRVQKMTMIGPNCAGVISPGKSMLGIMPGHIYKEGRIGIIGRLKIEKRPFLAIYWENNYDRVSSIFLQQAETVRVVCENGEVKSVTELSKGDGILCHQSTHTRHIGNKVNITSKEI